MRFQVTRISPYEKKPCEEAEAGRSNPWTDHPVWFIELGTLEDLLAFEVKYGKLVLRSADEELDEEGPEPVVEIYDFYRE